MCRGREGEMVTKITLFFIFFAVGILTVILTDKEDF